MPRLPKAARDLLKEYGLKEQDMRVLAAMNRTWQPPGVLAPMAGIGNRGVGASLARLVVVQPPVVSVRYAAWHTTQRGDAMFGKYEYRRRVVGDRLLALFEQARTETT